MTDWPGPIIDQTQWHCDDPLRLKDVIINDQTVLWCRPVLLKVDPEGRTDGENWARQTDGRSWPIEPETQWRRPLIDQPSVDNDRTQLVASQWTVDPDSPDWPQPNEVDSIVYCNWYWPWLTQWRTQLIIDSEAEPSPAQCGPEVGPRPVLVDIDPDGPRRTTQLLLCEGQYYWTTRWPFWYYYCGRTQPRRTPLWPSPAQPIVWTQWPSGRPANDDWPRRTRPMTQPVLMAMTQWRTVWPDDPVVIGQAQWTGEGPLTDGRRRTIVLVTQWRKLMIIIIIIIIDDD